MLRILGSVVHMVVVVHIQRTVVAKPLQAMRWSCVSLELAKQSDLHRLSICSKDERQRSSNTGLDKPFDLGNLGHRQEVHMVVARLVVYGCGIFLYVVSKGLFQSRHALLCDVRQLGLINVDVIDHNLKVAVLFFTTHSLGRHRSLPCYEHRLKISK